MFFYHGAQLYAVRLGEYKLHFKTKTSYTGEQAVVHDSPLLYHLGHDPSEKFDVAGEHPEVVAAITKLAEKHKNSFVAPANHLDERISN
jgi:hypothetical protein